MSQSFVIIIFVLIPKLNLENRENSQEIGVFKENIHLRFSVSVLQCSSSIVCHL